MIDFNRWDYYDNISHSGGINYIPSGWYIVVVVEGEEVQIQPSSSCSEEHLHIYRNCQQDAVEGIHSSH